MTYVPACLQRISSILDERGSIVVTCAEFRDLLTVPSETLRDCIKVLSAAADVVESTPAATDGQADGAQPQAVVAAELICDLCKNPLKMLGLAVVAFGVDSRTGAACGPVMVHKGQCHNSATAYLSMRAGESRFCELASLPGTTADDLSAMMMHEVDRGKVRSYEKAVFDRLNQVTTEPAK